MHSLGRRKEVETRVFHRVLVTLALLVLLIILGTFVNLAESDSYREAVYKSVTLVTHIDLANQSMGFISFLLYFVGGILSLVILITLIQLLFEGQLSQNLAEGKKMKKIQSLTNHIIICGAGRVGSNVAKSLAAEKIPFVLIDENPERIDRAEKLGWLALEDDSLEKKTLEAAGIKHAKSLVSCLSTDGDNILQVLTAKEMNPNMHIVARADFERSIDKLKNAGAEQVILPTHIGGQMLARVAMTPFKGQ
ncbi:MAG: NAD(P)-binding protein [Candidatus Woesearchaeota archaeon]